MTPPDPGMSATERVAAADWPAVAAALDQQKFTAREIILRVIEQHGQLQREHQSAVKILMQPVVITGAVFQHQRSRAFLPRAMA